MGQEMTLGVCPILGKSLTVNPLPGWSWMTDENCHIAEIGLELARWLGLDPEQVVEMADTVIFAEDREPNRMRWAQAVRLREEFVSRVRMFRSDGRLIWCVVRAEPVYLAGRFVGFRGVTVPLDAAKSVAAVASAAAKSASLGVLLAAGEAWVR